MVHLNESEVFIPVSEHRIYAKLSQPVQTRDRIPAALLVHGFTGDHSQKGRFDTLAEELCRWGCCSLRFDARGRGRSMGEFTVITMMEDIEAAYQYLAEQGFIDTSMLFVVARGQGAYCSLAALKNHDILAKVFWGAILYPKTSRELQGDYHSLRERGYAEVVISKEEVYRLEKSYFDSLEGLTHPLDCVSDGDNLLFIHAEDDDIAPFEHVEEFVGKLNRQDRRGVVELRKLAGLRHMHHVEAYTPDYITYTVNFVGRMLVSSVLIGVKKV